MFLLKAQDATLDNLKDASDWVGAALGEYLEDQVPAYQSITLFTRLSIEQVALRLNMTQKTVSRQSESRKAIDIPICYELGPDLSIVAKGVGLSENALIEAHLKAPYQTAFIGFTPGFLYLTGLPSALSFPRKATPRRMVEVGSVGIGGSQAGIYSLPSPGGWNIIGRTPQKLFDKEKIPPIKLSIGTSIQFKRISMTEFEQWES